MLTRFHTQLIAAAIEAQRAASAAADAAAARANQAAAEAAALRPQVGRLQSENSALAMQLDSLKATVSEAQMLLERLASERDSALTPQ